MRALLSGLAGTAGGAVGGFILMLGLLVARARIRGAYLNDVAEVVGWVGLPLVLAPIIGAWIGAAHPPGRSILPAAAVGLTTGATLGAALGTIGDDPSSKWAGMVMGGAAGLLRSSRRWACWPRWRRSPRRRVPSRSKPSRTSGRSCHSRAIARGQRTRRAWTKPRLGRGEQALRGRDGAGDALICPATEAARVSCMADGVQAFRTVWSEGL